MRVRLIRAAVIGVLAVIAIVAGSAGYVAYQSWGRVHDVADAPSASTVIVLGTQVRDGKPTRFLAGRLDAALDLVAGGKATDVLVSGDADGRSGDEIEAMTNYLVDAGVPADRITGDGAGVDTFATCSRAVESYGVRDALIVTQGLHVSRAVALCRAAGMEVEGVDAPCDCNTLAVVRNFAREWLARPKVVLDLMTAGAE